MINKVYETIVNYNIVKSNHTHYTSIIDTKDLYPELDFRIDIYSDFILVNKKYCDEDKVTVLCNFLLKLVHIKYHEITGRKKKIYIFLKF